MASYQDSSDPDSSLLIPPDNFSMVESCGIYRSGFPSKKNFPFLKSLGLRTVLYLCPEEYPEMNLAFLNSQHTQLLQYGVLGNKEPFLEIPHDLFRHALITLLDTRNHPILIHCNKGKHRTGCMVGVLHKALGWSLAAIFEEYRQFAQPKERFVDCQFIENLQLHGLTPPDESELAQYIVNPEANESYHAKKEKEKEAKMRAAGETTVRSSTAIDPPASTSHASLHHSHHEKSSHASSSISTTTNNQPHAASSIKSPQRPHHHQHTHSLPLSTAFVNNVNSAR